MQRFVVFLNHRYRENNFFVLKLHEAYPSNALPPLPELIRTASAKRRASFLQTLSRFGSHKEKNHGGAARSSNSATQNLGLIIPTQEPHELPTDMDSHGNVGALPDYLTTLANHPTLRTSRPWKRFVHVRADDLESTRVERQIKRVRSDVAVHTTRLDSIPHLPPILTDSLMDPFVTREADRASMKLATPLKETPIAEVDEEAAPIITSPDAHNAPLGEEYRDSGFVREVPLLSPEAEDTVQSPLQVDVEVTDAGFVAPTPPLGLPKDAFTSSEEREGTPTTPHQITVSMPSQPTQPSQPQGHARTVRSASADPTHRLSAGADNVINTTLDTWTSSTPKPSNGLDTDAEAAFDTDVEHPTDSGTTTPVKPSKKRVPRKVTVNDFEMMRVLGKGCAGKVRPLFHYLPHNSDEMHQVLLVKHKATGSLYALKAITKRHVLAHQELQHTLTEQAVLKRMAREGQDPFVVKLWWSFHDKENLFLVMVCMFVNAYSLA